MFNDRELREHGAPSRSTANVFSRADVGGYDDPRSGCFMGDRYALDPRIEGVIRAAFDEQTHGLLYGRSDYRRSKRQKGR